MILSLEIHSNDDPRLKFEARQIDHCSWNIKGLKSNNSNNNPITATTLTNKKKGKEKKKIKRNNKSKKVYPGMERKEGIDQAQARTGDLLGFLITAVNEMS
jgi:hypothetical protein